MKFNLNLYIDAIFTASRDDADGVRVDAKCEDPKELKKLEKLLKSV